MERTAPDQRQDVAPAELASPNERSSAPGHPASDGQDVRIDFANGDLPDPKLQRLHAIWLDKCGPDRLPGRADFDPVELPPDLLPWITIFDVERERFRIRLVGTGIVEALGMDTTGRHLDELPNTQALQDRARWVVAHAKPYFISDLTMVWDQDRYGRYSVLCAPLATDGAEVDKLLYLMSFGR